MEKEEPIFTRHSTRSYDASKRASTEQIDDILHAAMSAPSAMNRQPWEFIVVNKQELLEQIMLIHPYCASLGDAGTAIIVCGDLDKQYKTSDGGYWVYDCSAATENILLRAEQLGLSTCWCGISPSKIRVENFRKLFSLPQNVEPMSLVILGYSSATAKATDKFDKSKIHLNNW